MANWKIGFWPNQFWLNGGKSGLVEHLLIIATRVSPIYNISFLNEESSFDFIRDQWAHANMRLWLIIIKFWRWFPESFKTSSKCGDNTCRCSMGRHLWKCFFQLVLQFQVVIQLFAKTIIFEVVLQLFYKQT